MLALSYAMARGLFDSKFVSLLGENDLVEIWAPWVYAGVTFLILVLAWLMNHLAKGFMLRFLRSYQEFENTGMTNWFRETFFTGYPTLSDIVISFFLPQIWVGHPTAEGLIDAFLKSTPCWWFSSSKLCRCLPRCLPNL